MTESKSAALPLGYTPKCSEATAICQLLHQITSFDDVSYYITMEKKMQVPKATFRTLHKITYKIILIFNKNVCQISG